MRSLRFFTLTFTLTLFSSALRAEDGYRLWLRYEPIADENLRRAYAAAFTEIVVPDQPRPMVAAARDELVTGLRGLLGAEVPIGPAATRDGALILGTPRDPWIASVVSETDLRAAGVEGYILRRVRHEGKSRTLIVANREPGLLYGAFALLRHLQGHGSLDKLDVISAPRIQRRLLNHWDNLNGFVERGYAGFSLWQWFYLPTERSPRYRDYARACASIGLNGTVLTNVNANALILTPDYLRKAAALAEELRPYGVRVYLTARFSAPIEIGGLKTADPLDPGVAAWWRGKVLEIYRHIPDFGGFLVKANSEGQPGPQDYGRTHADGANMLADAVAPFNGIVMWRAFVYAAEIGTDRVKQAQDEFAPLDGSSATMSSSRSRTARSISCRANLSRRSSRRCRARASRRSSRSPRNISANPPSWPSSPRCGGSSSIPASMVPTQAAPSAPVQPSPRSSTAAPNSSIPRSSPVSPIPAPIATGRAICSPSPTGTPSAGSPGTTGCRPRPSSTNGRGLPSVPTPSSAPPSSACSSPRMGPS